MAFFGRETVEADLDLHRDMAGGVTAGTLNVLGSTAVPYANVCLWPPRQTTALGQDGSPNTAAKLTAWRVGEADAPQVDDSWVVGGATYLVVGVTSRFTADEAAGYCVYDCDLAATP